MAWRAARRVSKIPTVSSGNLAVGTVGTVTIGTIVLKNLWKASIEIIESSENWHLRTPTFEDVGCWALIFREDCHFVIVCGQTQVLHVVHVVDYTTYTLLHSGISQL